MATGDTKAKGKAGRPSADDVMWTVFCANAVPTKDNPTGIQEHETRDRTPYKLHHKDACTMPARHAVDFLIDQAFLVFDDNGERVFPRAPITAGAQAALQPGQVIVSLAELSDQAILVRAKQIQPLAEKKLGRAALIKIIESGVAEAPAESAGTDEEEADEAELGNDE
jgi:hypothetical protein